MTKPKPNGDDVLDLFAGIGGWGKGLGIDDNDDVMATRRAAKLLGLQANVARLQPLTFAGVTGICASPPCPPWSTANRGEGRADLELVAAALEAMGEGRDSRRELQRDAVDERSLLSVEPLRYVLALEPAWTIWEQVIGAQSLWEVAADILADRGYNVWTGIADAREYRVPQTRRRSLLIAHKSLVVHKPAPTGEVTMREALHGLIDDLPDAAVLRMGGSRGTKRTLDEQAPTIMFGKSPSGVAWYDGADVIRPITLPEALALQGFSASYPLRGGKVSQYGQVGNAVPVGLGLAARSLVA